MIAPFHLNVPQADLDDLGERLARTRWPDELPDAGRDYGFPLGELRELAEYWRTGYDWRAVEDELNALPQFTTEIDGQRIHFLHLRAPDDHALPLLLTHGWPGSVVEFLDVVRPLAERFHVVVPSIPGFGLSGPTHERGWDQHRVGRAWVTLMERLGYDRYGAHGGDWGSSISRIVGGLVPERVVGVHVNYLPTPPPADDDGLSADDRDRAAGMREYLAHQPGARILNGTTPQTVAYALTDSPVGQLAWIAERFAEWSDPSTPVDVDRRLTDVTLYWLTRTAGSAARLHRESPVGPLPCPVPVGVAVFRHDIVRPIRPLAERIYRITHWSEFERGGHFAALEVPDLLVDDIVAFFQKS